MGISNRFETALCRTTAAPPPLLNRRGKTPSSAPEARTLPESRPQTRKDRTSKPKPLPSPHRAS